MSSQSNILITQLIYDPEFDDTESSELPMIENGEIWMRFGHDGGPTMISEMLNLSFYHLKALCYHGHTQSLARVIELYDSLKSRVTENTDFIKQFEMIVRCDGQTFGLGVEYVSQILALAYGTQIYSLANNGNENGEDLWGEGEEACHIINCYGEGKNFTIDFNISENTGYTIAKDPSFFEELKQDIHEYNEKIITPEYKQYYIEPLERGFSIQYNMILALQIIRYREQILNECENKSFSDLYDGFMLNKKL